MSFFYSLNKSILQHGIPQEKNYTQSARKQITNKMKTTQ